MGEHVLLAVIAPNLREGGLKPQIALMHELCKLIQPKMGKTKIKIHSLSSLILTLSGWIKTQKVIFALTVSLEKT